VWPLLVEGIDELIKASLLLQENTGPGSSVVYRYSLDLGVRATRFVVK
jgi:hypothetical protein